LYKLDLLDTAPEKRFDYITEKVKRYFNVSIALITLIDEDRQWFKSRQGTEVLQTHRDISFCGHAINHQDIFIVPDTFLDERFIDNPLVTDEPHIRFYAGAPIRSSDGFNIGTLCIIDGVPRTFVANDLVVLRELADMVEGEINKPPKD
jgi:GAF domain-containing protein